MRHWNHPHKKKINRNKREQINMQYCYLPILTHQWRYCRRAVKLTGHWFTNEQILVKSVSTWQAKTEHDNLKTNNQKFNKSRQIR